MTSAWHPKLGILTSTVSGYLSQTYRKKQFRSNSVSNSAGYSQRRTKRNSLEIPIPELFKKQFRRISKQFAGGSSGVERPAELRWHRHQPEESGLLRKEGS